MRIWWCCSLPLYLDGIIFTQLDTIVPQLEGQVCRPEVHFDDKVDAVVLLATVPPVPVFQFKLREWDGGEV